MDGIAFARALHVLGVVIWVGGVAFVTTVVLPAIRSGDLGTDRLQAFHAVERRFAWLARTAVLVVGATGFYIVSKADLWGRFRLPEFWWMHAMLGVWSLFAVLLFVVEPLRLGARLDRLKAVESGGFLAYVQRLHWVLLVLALVALFGAVAGAHGWSPLD